MSRNIKIKRTIFLFAEILLMMILAGVTGCNGNAPSEVRKTIPGTIPNHNTRFGVYILRLMSMPEYARDTAVRNLISFFPNSPVVEDDSIVSLYWFGKSKQILINGDLQLGWSRPDTMERIPCGENAFFYITYTIPSNARLDYHLIVDTTVTTDPRNPVITPSGYGPHSEIAMPGFKPDPVRQFRPDVPHGSVGSMFFKSHEPNIKSRQVKIYVPAGYKNLSHLPVLYVLDGLEAFDFMSYSNVLDNLIADRRIGPVLVVFIPPVDRYSEYLGQDQQAFMNAICNDLVPFIDRKFKTACEPQKRGITGISAGGHLALLMIFNRPDVFQCGAGQSPTINDQLYKSFQSFIRKGKSNPLLHIYLDVGRFDLPASTVSNLAFLQANEDFQRELEKNGIIHNFKVVNDGHEWANWRERTDDILIYFFGLDK